MISFSYISIYHIMLDQFFSYSDYCLKKIFLKYYINIGSGGKGLFMNRYFLELLYFIKKNVN